MRRRLGAGLYSTHAGPVLPLGIAAAQYLLELGVLFEIAWNVLRPVQCLAPPGQLFEYFIGFCRSLAAAGGTLLAWHVHDTGNKVDDIKAPLDLTVGLLRMLIFAVTAGFAQLLGIGWKNKVLQLATALSFYSAVRPDCEPGGAPLRGSNTLEPLRGVAYLLKSAF